MRSGLSAMVVCIGLSLAQDVAAQTVHTVDATRTALLQRTVTPDLDIIEGPLACGGLQASVLGFEAITPTETFFYYLVRRSYIEFSIPDITGPLTATLILKKTAEVGFDETDPRILVSVYDPDTNITLSTFSKATVPFDSFVRNPNVIPEEVALDVTDVVRAYTGRNLGLRLAVADEGEPGLFPLQAGAVFADGDPCLANGDPPRLEIVEQPLGDAIADLQAQVADVLVGSPLAETVAQTLGSAVALVIDDNTSNDGAAVNMLKALIRKVEAQAGKKITVAQAGTVISSVEYILSVF